MTLVDTSVWISHFQSGNRDLVQLLNEGGVLCHPFVIGEMACGHLSNRKEVLSLLRTLPQTPLVDFDEFLHFVDHRHLVGVGIGFVDGHLLASAIASGTTLWAADKKLGKVASRLGIAFP